MSIKQAIEALDGVIDWDASRNYPMPSYVLNPLLDALAALRSMPAEPVARVNNDVDLLLRAVFELCEATEEAPEVEPKNEHQRGFDRGRRFEAKDIRRAVGDWFQATFCGRSFMGEPVIATPPTAASDATPPATAAGPSDAERLDWLEQNLFHVEPDEWTAKYSPHLNTWRIFAPKGVQGSARTIIDAAIRATKGGKL